MGTVHKCSGRQQPPYSRIPSSTIGPGETPSDTPTDAPVDDPSEEPNESPASYPSDDPAGNPSASPSANPSDEQPSETPSKEPKPQTDPQGNKGENSSNAIPAWAANSLPSLTVERKNGLAVISNPSSLYVLVNKKRNLSSSYAPKDLVQPDIPFSFDGDSPKKKLRRQAAEALEKLFAGAGKAGIELKGVSGYRSYATQKAIFTANADKKGEAEANRTSAYPGQSEHQTGLAIDVSSAAVGYALEESFGKTKEGKWLAAHASEYGFIIRYPKGKEKITGYKYEPWHIRYIGKEAAKDITASGQTLEQYFDALEASVVK
ncbi:M15 family metallopeptidase [Cohnella faecalis]|uniref:D-alanyl-D-alanine carboxypeptidase family protein n=1 Tax=Cohnella faecalis TaxID=2315694 RepID=A0A398CKV8_9BACL|nr:M15 family metallopeptidase [Cohnella faecalis]RIE02802.1 D-alanyl-D-alanine carboxypeptidase family protein [Cohnella faecalis]